MGDGSARRYTARMQVPCEDPSSFKPWSAPERVEVRLQTPRLVIRGFELDDAPAMFETISGDRDALLPWMPWAKKDHHELYQSVAYIAAQMQAARTLGETRVLGLGVFESASGDQLGGIGIHHLQPLTASCEIGYWMRSTHRGRGITPEAVAHLLSWLFTPQGDGRQPGGLGLSRARIFCSSANVASSRVPAKLGLVEEVRQRRDYFIEGYGPTDRLGWGVLSSEWDRVTHRMR